MIDFPLLVSFEIQIYLLALSQPLLYFSFYALFCVILLPLFINNKSYKMSVGFMVYLLSTKLNPQ